ncbi:phosphotyrosyl phosphatase activator protein-related [Cryptosporidium canis]|uniref:Serine/threonine-protein phosphatase 2A activator n=1 Tax=Cryptosporidium canis TaxID=195482 RepID=A0ABQ8P2N0_9CRYT|nr:phosphotyrosyl phosphatase activator protein-related [Cryptosporidium canis]KAJ1612279.1 phosphotyrosyl phosphatase activator protein-related [Cryptosporidium canis]
MSLNEKVECTPKITDLTQLNNFICGKTHSDIIEFIKLLSESVNGRALVMQQEYFEKNSNRSDSGFKSLVIIIELLSKLDSVVDEIPPIKQPMRFGNKAFQTWYDRADQICTSYISDILGENSDEYLGEVKCYFIESFGNRSRVDYGTGHELNFILFLMCIYRLGVFQTRDFPDIILVVFYRYILLMRKLQSIYLLEPAGSRGVWGLDDYQFLPFLFGSAQFINSNGQFPILTSQILDHSVLDTYSTKSLYINSIQHILTMKTNVYFAECSPILYSLTSVPTWEKIYSGMIKMYVAEILNKFPIAQHISFGNLIPFC